MKKVILAVVAIMFAAVSAQASGLNGVGQSGGFLTPNAQISNRLSVNTSYTDLDGVAANQVGVTVGVFKRLEAGYSRLDNNTNVYHAKLGFAFKQETLATAFAVGVQATDVESVSDTNYDVYLAGQLTIEALRNADLTIVLRSTDALGRRDYLGEGSLGVEVVKGWAVYGEYAQKQSNVDNDWSAYVQRDLGNAVLKAGVTDGGLQSGGQFFLSGSVSGI